jgi:hypothetical protein
VSTKPLRRKKDNLFLRPICSAARADEPEQDLMIYFVAKHTLRPDFRNLGIQYNKGRWVCG